MKHFRFGEKTETSLNLLFFIYFQESEFSRSAFGCHENSDPGKQIKKKDFNSPQSYYLKCFMVTQCSEAATARKDRDIYPFRFIAVASRGYKS